MVKKSPAKGRGRGRGRGGRGKSKRGKGRGSKKVAKNQKGGKGKRGFKDPDKPKRALSAYNLMARECRDGIKASMSSDAKATDIMKEIARVWSTMNDAQKAPYQEQAAEQKVIQE